MTIEPDLISTSLRMFAALFVILGGLIAVLYYVKRRSRGGPSGPSANLVTILGNTYLGVKKYISLVEVPGAILVLGITNDTISLLATIDDEQLMAKIRGCQGGLISPSFSEQLRKLSASFRGRNNTKQ
ncbi:MAG: flagellar biosynthetic protein FliO [Thermodesulfobacteriota bacterium]|nr:flagellar biosynthetic protein FliO [Thermodesulfobacteriota bacterium]